MRLPRIAVLVALTHVMADAAYSQTLPPIRSVGPVTRVSAHGLLRSAANARQFADGRVIVGDLRGQRVVILDAALQRRVNVGDTSTTGSSAGFLAGVIPYRGDSTLLVDREAVAFLVVDARGEVGRVMAMPRPKDLGQLLGGPFGMPGFDRAGRLIYRASAWMPFAGSNSDRGPTETDSAAIVRLNLEARTIDTITLYKIVPNKTRRGRSTNGDSRLASLLDPMPLSDEWGVLSDGTVAVVRGRDYHVDFYASDGTKRSAPKMPYAWVRMTEQAKAAFRDSVITYNTALWEASRKEFDLQRKQLGLPPAQGPGFECLPLSTMPDYIPPFGNNEIRGSIVRVDRDDNLWVRTNTVSNGGPVYDVINPRGLLTDRVRLPYGRSIAGFGDQSVLMAVIDGESVLLEVARMK